MYRSKELFSKFVDTVSKIKINAERAIAVNKGKRTTSKLILNSL